MAELGQEAWQRIASDPNESGPRRIAALDWLDSVNPDRYHATPLRRDSVERILDRTAGKPIQRVEANVSVRQPDEIMADILAIIRACPELASELAPALALVDPASATNVSQYKQSIETDESK
jgi:hypothetical protein